MLKVCLDLHDFSVVNNRLDLLLRLKEHFPSFKVSLFTVPIDKEEDWGPSLVRDDFLKEIKKNLDWIQLIPHGLIHDGSEMINCSYGKFRNEIIPQIEASFKRDGLPYEKGFCAPHWRWSDDVVRALDDMGWWGAVYKGKKMPYTKKYYEFSHCLNEEFSEQEVLKLHGHVYGTRNDLGRCMDKLVTLPLSTEWVFCTDLLEEK